MRRGRKSGGSGQCGGEGVQSNPIQSSRTPADAAAAAVTGWKGEVCAASDARHRHRHRHPRADRSRAPDPTPRRNRGGFQCPRRRLGSAFRSGPRLLIASRPRLPTSKRPLTFALRPCACLVCFLYFPFVAMMQLLFPFVRAMRAPIFTTSCSDFFFMITTAEP